MHTFKLFVCVFTGIAVASPNCDTYKDCTSCAAATTWTGNHCRWCPKTNDCHAEGSPFNKCSEEEQITNKDSCPRPVEQVHIAFAGRNENGDSNGVTVSWATAKETETSIVKYGLSKTSLTSTVSGFQKQYLEEGNYHHFALVPNLKAGTVYYYQCGDDKVGFSEVFSFVSAKSSDPEFGNFKLSIFGDWGYSKNGNAIPTRKALEKIKNEVDFIWHVGDIGYADDAFLHDATSFEYENVYNGYMQWISNISESKPYMVAPGNHEAECHSPVCLAESKLRNSLNNFTAFNTRWHMPFESSNASSNMWYSFNYGLAHFIVINSETDFTDAPEEGLGPILPSGSFGAKGAFLEWLENDLKQAQKERTLRPWIFAGGHRPVYSDSAHTALQNAVEDLFHEYGVDLYFCGHEHSYTRTYPVYKKKVQSTYEKPDRTAYVVVGGAGCDEMTPEGPDGYNTSAEWIVTHDHHYGTGVLEVVNASAVKWTYILSDDLSVKDQFWLTK
mmetsp:Transcript_3187/g.4798  ORF Transcript_3187/g.4798 Transcript_3187/m.4798 type:complete len:500 (+) Transcript_3187:76-1575(+)